MRNLRGTLDAWPPSLVCFLARSGMGRAARRLSLREIAALSGLSVTSVQRLSAMDTWDHVTISVGLKLMEGCGFNPFKVERHTRHLKQRLKSSLAYAGDSHEPARTPTASTIVRAVLSSRPG